MEPSVLPECTEIPDCEILTSFQILIDWVSRVNSLESWCMLKKLLKHKCAWVRGQTAWFLRRWQSSELSILLGEALIIGVQDPTAYEHAFFILWRLIQLSDSRVLPLLESLIGTEFDKEIKPPDSNIQPSNMLRQAILVCGGSI